jgi:outer membrane receptor protein involved in Fe transport
MDPETSDNGPTDSTPYDYYITAPPRVFMFGVRVTF